MNHCDTCMYALKCDGHLVCVRFPPKTTSPFTDSEYPRIHSMWMCGEYKCIDETIKTETSKRRK